MRCPECGMKECCGAEMDPEIERLRCEVERLTAERDSANANLYAEALNAVEDLIADSNGVAGLHRNGDVAPWSELLRGGRFESWLGPVSDALERMRDEGGVSNMRDAIEAATIERCAKVCDTIAGNWKDFGLRDIRKGAGQCAAAIRALKERQG